MVPSMLLRCEACKGWCSAGSRLRVAIRRVQVLVMAGIEPVRGGEEMPPAVLQEQDRLPGHARVHTAKSASAVSHAAPCSPALYSFRTPNFVSILGVVDLYYVVNASSSANV